jgi:hypothetical protein
MTVKPYRDYADFLSEHFSVKMQKLSVNVGRSCPNRDGTIGRGGCAYCNNSAFTPGYCLASDSVAVQLEKGCKFFGKKYPMMRYLAYFQSYTSTHGGLDAFKQLCEEALVVDGVDGMVVGTRPDCFDSATAEYLGELRRSGKFVMMEFGAESAHDVTLQRVNRCHTWRDTVEAVERAKACGLATGVHLIMGLPGETRDMMFATVDAVNVLRPDTVKFHHLQLVEGTRLAADVARGVETVDIWDVDAYIAFCCEVVARLHPSIAIERFTSQSPGDMLIAPRWGLKNYEYMHLLQHRLSASGITQGCRCSVGI